MALREQAMRTYHDLGLKSADRSMLPPAGYPLGEMHPGDGPGADIDYLIDTNTSSLQFNTSNLAYNDHYSKGESAPQTNAKRFRPHRRSSPLRRKGGNTRECPLLLSYGDATPRPLDSHPSTAGLLTHSLAAQPAYDWELNDAYDMPRDTSVPPADGNNRFDIGENWAYSQSLRPRVDIEQSAQDQALLDFKGSHDSTYRKKQESGRERIRVTASDDYLNSKKGTTSPFMLDVGQHYF
ncbi:hypothetical protein JKP88DRAFT_240890 [Tribonema minus]|uniref:Uncharacterized protein n=1 Tax=Tribonema minus TaxID=303371 RepID=A0A836CK06_9STRA|nr:hypothetical protein JKP88DRAFT_240890 [Tribonema minus]